jgi:nucleotide-binding universal stress UspA family protein
VPNHAGASCTITEAEMIKAILVPTSGSRTDDGVFATALAIARPLAAQLLFYHLRFTECEAAVRTPHVQFCRGRAMVSALESLREQSDRLSAKARKHFEAFCGQNEITVRTMPSAAFDRIK